MTEDQRLAVPIHLRRFTPLPEADRNNTVRPLSARLATGRWLEHREAAAFIEAHCTGHGDAIDTLVRALLHYRDHLIESGVIAPAPQDPAEPERLFPSPATAAPRRAAGAKRTAQSPRRARA